MSGTPGTDGRGRPRSLRLAPAVAAVTLAISGMSAAPARSATAELFGETVYYRADPGEANDLVVGGGGLSVAFRDAGATIQAGEGCQSLASGGVACGADRSRDTAPRKIEISLGDGADRASSEVGGSLVTDVEMNGGPGPDTLYSGSGTGDTHTLFGGAGDDELSTATNNVGRSTFVGGPGDDVLRLREGGLAWFYGGPGDDELRQESWAGLALVMDGGRGADLYLAGSLDYPEEIVNAIRPGPGTDTLSAATSGPLNVDLAACGGCVENVIGSANDDSITGDDRSNVIVGGGGNDILVPRGGRDEVSGGAGDDQIDTRDAELDAATCGAGTDQVNADAVPADAIAADCEDVVRFDLRPSVVFPTTAGDEAAAPAEVLGASRSTSAPAHRDRASRGVLRGHHTRDHRHLRHQRGLRERVSPGSP